MQVMITVTRQATGANSREIRIDTPEGAINGDLTIPVDAVGMVIFAHGSGSSRHSPRNRFVAQVLQEAGLATLLVDLLTAAEEDADLLTQRHRFDIALLARRLLLARGWVQEQEETADLTVGYFGASTGAAAAIVAAAGRDGVGAIVSRGGRVDMANEALEQLSTPILLIVGGNDPPVLGINREAVGRMRTRVELAVIPGAGHLFEGPGQLEHVSRLAADFFREHLGA